MARKELTDAQLEERFFKNKPGRPAKEITTQDTDHAIDTEKVAGAMVAMRDQAQQDQEELIELATGIGALQAFDLIQKFASAAHIKLFKRIRESKQIKHLPIRLKDGSSQKFDSIKEACPALFGRTYQSMLDAEEKFDTFGEEVYEGAARLRLNDSALRAARALPPEKLEVIRTAIGNGSTKAEVLSVIEDLAEKVQQAETATAEVRAELKASEDVLATKNKTIDKLQRDLRRIEKLPPDEQLAGLKKEATAIATEAEGFILGGLRQALAALSVENGQETRAHDVFMAGLVGQVQAQINALREEFNLPDVSNAADQRLASEMAEWDKE